MLYGQCYQEDLLDIYQQGPLLLMQINFNLSMDK